MPFHFNRSLKAEFCNLFCKHPEETCFKVLCSHLYMGAWQPQLCARCRKNQIFNRIFSNGLLDVFQVIYGVYFKLLVVHFIDFFSAFSVSVFYQTVGVCILFSHSLICYKRKSPEECLEDKRMMGVYNYIHSSQENNVRGF